MDGACSIIHLSPLRFVIARRTSLEDSTTLTLIASLQVTLSHSPTH